MAKGLAKFVGVKEECADADQNFARERREQEISVQKQFESHSLEEGIKNVNGV
jgi:hypothetical protein